MNGLMTSDFASLSTVIQSHQDDRRMIIKDCIPFTVGRFRLERGSHNVARWDIEYYCFFNSPAGDSILNINNCFNKEKIVFYFKYYLHIF